MGRGNSTKLVIINQHMPRGHSTGIAQGGGTELESTGRGHLNGISIPKGARSQICENHVVGALRWNPQGGDTQFGNEMS